MTLLFRNVKRGLPTTLPSPSSPSANNGIRRGKPAYTPPQGPQAVEKCRGSAGEAGEEDGKGVTKTRKRKAAKPGPLCPKGCWTGKLRQGKGKRGQRKV
eukprot:6551-Chlamydomonas_euryale.AAC.4